MLTFAYDGTLNGDWVAHYAIRFARNTAERRLRLVHVREGGPSALPGERLERLAEECRVLGVRLDAEVHDKGRGTVVERLLDVVTPGPETLLVTGTRARPRRMAFLAGTVSARLFAAGRFPLVALRVVHPGLLGQPGRLLLPAIDRAGAAREALPLLRRFGTELGRVHVQWIHTLSRIRFRMLGVAAAEHLLEEAGAAAVRLEGEIQEQLDLATCTFDAGAVVTDDWPKEILIAAGRQKSGIICLPAPGRDIPGRIFFGTAVEQVLRSAPCDVAVYRGLE